MDKQQIFQKLKDKMGQKILTWNDFSDSRTYLEISSEHIAEITQLLFVDLNARFQIATGVDTADSIEILYHWSFDQQQLVITVRTKLDRNKPEIESMALICKATEWIEREIWELLGVNFLNHPDLRHLLLKDDWQPNQCPLRKDYNRE
jgi:NADH-quinone oxidoreductase subunit C